MPLAPIRVRGKKKTAAKIGPADSSLSKPSTSTSHPSYETGFYATHYR